MNKENKTDYRLKHSIYELENEKLKREIEEYKQTILDMAKINSVVIQLSNTIKEINDNLKILTHK